MTQAAKYAIGAFGRRWLRNPVYIILCYRVLATLQNFFVITYKSQRDGVIYVPDGILYMNITYVWSLFEIFLQHVILYLCINSIRQGRNERVVVHLSWLYVSFTPW